MTRFHGAVGYATLTEVPVNSGVWLALIVERNYYGDVIRNTRKLEPGQGLNSDIVVSNSISILADDFIIAHFHRIRYVAWAGELWTVTDVEVRRPRLILSLGEVYNGPTA